MQKRYPFKFLDAYTREDSPFFFGRTEEIEELYTMVFETDILLVYGFSGTGKSSLIQCGLASKFQSHEWLALNIRRGNNLNESFEKALQEAGTGMTLMDIDFDWLNQERTSSHKTATSSKNSSLIPGFRKIYLKHFKPIYLVFDQFEELYIRGNKNEEEQFIKTIQEILLIEQPIKIIFSIQEEYLGYLYNFERAFPELQRKKLRVERMNLSKVSSVIKGVGQQLQSNVRLQTGAEDVIVEDIFKAILGKEKNKRLFIELPYLQVFLDKLYLQITQDENRRREAIITRTALDKMPDFEDVLRDFLDDQVLKISQKLKETPKLIWNVLSPLVTLEGTKAPLNAVQLREHLEKIDPALIDTLLQAFLKSRILRFIEDEQLYEIAHDSLARQIHARRSHDEIAVLTTRQMVKNVVSFPERATFNEGQLRLIDTYLQKVNLSKEEKDWIEQSRRHNQKELDKTRRQLRTVLILLVFAVLVLLGAGYFGVSATRASRREALTLQNSYRSEIKRLEGEIEFVESRQKSLKANNSSEKDVIEWENKKIDSLTRLRDSLNLLLKN